MSPVIAEQVRFTVESGLLLLALLIVVGPLLAERIRLPGLVGLIFLGMLCGPFVLEWLEPEGMVAAVGEIGLLYLMFMAGIELDIGTFLANRRAAITFGILTFAIPFGLSFWVGTTYLGYAGASAALIGAMWASHTLVAYPEVKDAGLETNRAVGSAVSATVITDVLALVILGVAASQSGDGEASTLPVWAGIIVLAGFCLWLLPLIAEWFFKRVGRQRNQRFVFAVAGMAAGATLSLVGGIEGLVGAFLAGIGLNRLVPAEGQLMDKIEFFGSAFFIPAFLISVGLSIDPSAMAEAATIRLALVFTALVLVGKGAAAVISGRLFGLTWPEIGMAFALTVGQAAATLAIAQVGVEVGAFGQNVLNAAVLAVVITVIITSLGTRYIARRIPTPPIDPGRIGAHVLVQVAGDAPLDGVIHFAGALTRNDKGLVTPFVVCHGHECPDARERLSIAVQLAIDDGHDSEGISRVSHDVAEGTLNLAVETRASLIVLPWRGPRFPGDLAFGNDIDAIGAGSRVPVAAAKIHAAEWDRILVITGRVSGIAARQEDVALCIDIALRLAARQATETVVHTPDLAFIGDPDRFTAVHTHAPRTGAALDEARPGDLVIAPAHVVADAIGLGLARLARALHPLSVVVVGGPGRLRVASPGFQGGILGAVGLTRAERLRAGRVAASEGSAQHAEG